MPGGNQYGNQQGTSMSTPIVSGIAALIRSYYSDLSAAQVKKIIEKSVWIPDTDNLCFRPGTKADIVPFTALSKTGGIVNAYNAVLAADQFNNTNISNSESKPAVAKKNKTY